MQSPATLHRAPFGRLPQLPAVQTFGATHWVSVPQLAVQAVPLQPRKGEQVRAAGMLHLPAAQVPAGVSVLAVALQLPARQTVPLA
jgi:hypothetical protein